MCMEGTEKSSIVVWMVGQVSRILLMTERTSRSGMREDQS